MNPSVLACPETLVDLVLNPGWDGCRNDLEIRQEAIRQLKELLEAERVSLYVPPELLVAVHLIVSVGTSRNSATYAIARILKLSTAMGKVDFERVAEQASLLISDCDGVELYEAVLPCYAQLLKVDAVLARNPSPLRILVERSQPHWSDVSAWLVKPESFVSHLLEHRLEDSTAGTWVHVCTPQSNIVRLPIGSTPIDFAYTIHTDIGNQCVEAFVNGQKASLSRPLQDYDIVEIVRGAKAEPQEEWLGFAKTRYARKKISRGLKRIHTRQGWLATKQSFGDNIRAYKRKLEQVARNHHWTLDDLMAKVGCGQISIESLQQRLQSVELKQVHEEVVCLNPEDITVLGQQDVNWQLSSCCLPLPGDPITGVLDVRNKTVRVHHSDCSNLSRVKPEKLCFPAWNCGFCSVQLLLFMNDQPDVCRPVLDLLADILTSRESKPDLRGVQISQDGTARVAVRLPVASREDLNGIIARIHEMPGVLRVKVTKLIPLETMV